MTSCPFCNLDLIPEQKSFSPTGRACSSKCRKTCWLAPVDCAQVTQGDGVRSTPEEWRDTHDLLQRVKELLDAELAPDGYNVGWNSGSAAGQHIFHAHFHVIPRFADEPLAGKGIRHWLKQPQNMRPHSVTN